MLKRLTFCAVGLLFFIAPLFAYAGSTCVTLSHTLVHGSHGNDVIQLQQFLITQGSLQSGLATGYFGALTEAGVRSWQSKNSLDSIGIVGPKTRAAIAKMCNGFSKSPTLSHPEGDLTASPASGQPPLTVTFSIFRDQHSYFIDFGDGATSSPLTAQSCTSSTPPFCTYSVSHTYTTAGLYEANPNMYDPLHPYHILVQYGGVWIAVGGTQMTPTLSSVSPSQGAAGTRVTLTGSGFLAGVGTVILDGKYRLLTEPDSIKPTSDTSLTFNLSAYVGSREACANLSPGVTCTSPAIAVQPGQHTMSIQNSNGTSNSLTFTVTN